MTELCLGCKHPKAQHSEGRRTYPCDIPYCSCKMYNRLSNTEVIKYPDQSVGKPNDPVNHPSHYVSHPSGVECIQVTEHMNFNVGNAVKYLWRADLKNGLEDLKKAAWYVNREIERRSKNV